MVDKVAQQIQYVDVEVSQPELKALADAVHDENVDYLARSKAKVDLEGQRRYMEAYRRIAKSDPVQQNWDKNEAEFRAKTRIFAVMADGFESELGREEGRAAVRRVRARQGQEMGELMAARVRARGEPLSLNSMFAEFWSYFSWSPHVDNERYYDADRNLVRYVLRLNCPIGEYLRENAPDVEFSSNFCDLDEFIAKSFNPNIYYYRKHWVPVGDLYSELVWELDPSGIID